MKALIKQPKITEFFIKTKKTNIIKRGKPHNVHTKKTPTRNSHLKQTTIHSKMQIPPPSKTPKLPSTPQKYNKRKYSNITNYLEGKDRTKLSTITFLEKQVILSSSRAPYFNRFNKKFSNNKPLNRTP